MKRIGNLTDKIAEYDNLMLAAHKAFRGKNSSLSVVKYRNNFIENIFQLRTQIITGNIDVGNYNRFTIYEPKERIICAASLNQRILHHAIMNVCHDYFDKTLIFDSYASRPGKGLHKAVMRLKGFVPNYKYYVKLDVRKYFESIDHSILRAKLQRIFKDFRLLNIFTKIINSYGRNCVGLPIGNLTSQYFANLYLSGLDHYMKETVKCPAYIRYMDDVVIMSRSRIELRHFILEYCNYAMSILKLRIKPPIIGRTVDGILFLGFRVYRDNICLGGKAKRRYKRNIIKLKNLFLNRKINEIEYSRRLSSTLSYVTFAQSYKFRKLFGLTSYEL